MVKADVMPSHRWYRGAPDSPSPPSLLQRKGALLPRRGPTSTKGDYSGVADHLCQIGGLYFV